MTDPNATNKPIGGRVEICPSNPPVIARDLPRPP
jgi:hypothetical protein